MQKNNMRRPEIFINKIINNLTYSIVRWMSTFFGRRSRRRLKIGCACLTGKSRNRGGLIECFNEPPDRWWNAAREDQATDRVHRIGQRRGVQVFKLVTEGTLEEKIAALIARKRKLLDSVVKEDDPGLLKSFTREELIDLMDLPADTK
jgi:hypothetical protein